MIIPSADILKPIYPAAAKKKGAIATAKPRYAIFEKYIAAYAVKIKGRASAISFDERAIRNVEKLPI